MELRNYLHKNQPNIVLLQETWLKKKSTVSFPGYSERIGLKIMVVKQVVLLLSLERMPESNMIKLKKK